MHKATLFSDNDESIDNTEGDSCSHELGCIGGDGLEGTPRMNKFLKSISKSQIDHIWPKSRTPTNYLEEKVESDSMVLCEYHNKNKNQSLHTYLYLKNKDIGQ